MDDKLRERLTDEQHAIWSHWMRYMFSCGAHQDDGTWIMPADKVERWQRQMETPYSGLTDKERESDREQADKVLAVVHDPRLQTAIIVLATISGPDGSCAYDEALETLDKYISTTWPHVDWMTIINRFEHYDDLDQIQNELFPMPGWGESPLDVKENAQTGGA